MSKEFAIKVNGVGHSFSDEDGKKFEALKGISFDVKRGEFFIILGPSGCGKSTLLRILAGIMRPSHGWVEFPHGDKNLAFIFQAFALFPWLNVYENVEFGLKMRGASREKRVVLVREHIQEIGLTYFEDSYPKDLSGGMKQRVGIARALAINPKILLMDEPFSSLDAFTAAKLRKEILDLWLKDRMTIVMVTHLVDEAVEMADRILVMTPRPGRAEEVLTVNLPRPRNKRSQEFFALVDKIMEIVKV